MAEIIGSKIINLLSVDSTNNYATAHMANEGWLEGTVVLADQQTKGRGQKDNEWESEAGENLLLSIVLYPEFLSAQFQFLLSKIAALSIYDTISKIVDNVSIKWPNDIYVGDKKIAGILIENAIMGNTLASSILGIGINVNQQVFISNAPNPVSLYQKTGKKSDRKDIQINLLQSFNKWYKLLQNGQFELIHKSYENNLYRLNELALYSDKKGDYEGVLKGVSPIGQLLIKPNVGELRAYHFKEVAFIL